MNSKGRPEGERRSAAHEGSPVHHKGRPEGTAATPKPKAVGWWTALLRLVRGPRERPALDYLLARAPPQAPLAERVQWLAELMQWVRVHQPPRPVAGAEDVADTDAEAGRVTQVSLAQDTLRVRAARVRFLLRVLDRQPQWKANVARTLRAILRDAQGVRLFGATGLPQEHAFWSEFGHRLGAHFAPALRVDDDLADIFRLVFCDADDPLLLESLPYETLAGLRSLLRYDEPAEEACWAVLRRDLDDAVTALGSRIAATGVDDAIRRRGAPGSLRRSPFLGLRPAAEQLFELLPAPAGDPGLAAALQRYAQERDGCRRALDDVVAHLEENGVSVALVYRVELARWQIARLDRLVQVATGGPEIIGSYTRFLAALLREMHARRSVRELLRNNLTLLTRTIAERTGRTGEHYITRDAAEYVAMLRSSAKGGAVTGVTVFGKFATAGHGLAPFFEGLTASLNYALSFCVIQFAHGTLATKQPAMTAAAMAAKLRQARHRGRLTEFVQEVAHLTRSQVAAIVGNLAVVVPAALAVQGLWLLAGGGALPAAAKASATVSSLALLGPTPIYAAFTGVLLWFSAVLSGWIENWATYRRLPAAIAGHPRLVHALGPPRAQAFARWFEENVAGLGGNVALGFLLGMSPVAAAFFGLPLDVRHVTLATGSLAMAVSTLGAGTLLTAPFWHAVAGIAATGALNLGVSFALALWVAIRSTGAKALSRRRVYRAVVSRLLAAPRDFLLPPRST